MTPPAHFALLDESGKISFTDLTRIANSVDAQLKEDLYNVWYRHADITAFAHEEGVSENLWKVYIKEVLDSPGALGYHTDELGQPVAYVAAQDGDLDAIATTVSHEAIETVCDFSGNRLIWAIHPMRSTGKVRILCEPCDPSEAKSYPKLGLQVSDFYTPEWFDDIKKDGVRYSFLDAISGPREIIQGGYCSWVDSIGQWWQSTWWSGAAPALKGPFNWQLSDGMSLREMIDKETRIRRADNEK